MGERTVCWCCSGTGTTVECSDEEHEFDGQSCVRTIEVASWPVRVPIPMTVVIALQDQTQPESDRVVAKDESEKEFFKNIINMDSSATHPNSRMGRGASHVRIEW